MTMRMRPRLPGAAEGGLAVRLERQERMDDLSIGGVELREALAQLGWINRLLGAAQVTREGLVQLWRAAGRPRRLHVLDVGAGGGDINWTLLRWARRAGVRLSITLLDRHPETCAYAAHRFRREPRVKVVQGDLQALTPRSADIVTASLVLHHLPTLQIPWTLLHWQQAARIGVVVNDLHRHPLALAGIRLATGLLSRNPMIRHDAPLSVRRGFQAVELADMRGYPGLEGLQYRWRPLFRYLITLQTPGPSHSS